MRRKSRRHRSRRLHRLAPLRAPAGGRIRGRRRRRPLVRVDAEPRAVPRPSRASGSRCSTAATQRELRAAFDGCDAIAHLAAKKIPRYGGALSTLEVNVAGCDAACGVALSLGADLVVTSTSDVYGNGTPPFAEDDPLVLGPPTTRRWAYAVSKLYDEHLALALAEERGLSVTILRLFNAYGPAQPPQLVGRPGGDVRRGAARRRADGDPRRRPADADVHATSATPSRASSARSRRPRPAAR